MTESERDPILDAFTRRLATVERLVPARPPELSLDAEAPRINLVGGTSVRGRNGSGSFVRKLALPFGLAATVVIGLVGMSLYAGDRVGSGPDGTPAASPGTLDRTFAMQPPVRLAFGAGWSVVNDSPRDLTVESIIGSGANSEKGSVTIAALDNVSVNPCQTSGAARPTRPWTPTSAATGPQELMDWIESSSGLPHDPPSPVTIVGIAGLKTTLSPGVGSLGSCGGVAILSSLGAGQDLRIGENEAVRLAAIPVGDRTVVIVTHVPRAVLLGDFESKADGLIDSMIIGPAK